MLLSHRLVVSVLALSGGAAALAGPLDPPAGPIAPTHKTLSEVEPRIAVNALNTPGDADALFRISEPGSYYLTGNMTGIAGKFGIEIAAGGVTLDLNGYDLAGVPGAFDGVVVTASAIRVIEVRNGSIRNWPNNGVNFESTVVSAAVIRDLRCSANGLRGIGCGWSSRIINCTVYSCGLGGISAEIGSVITGCTTSYNGGIGIDVTSGVITDCTANANTGDGFEAGSGSVLRACSSVANTGNGFDTVGAVNLTECVALNNTAAGIVCTSAATVANCNVRLNGLDGIRVNVGCVVVGNTTHSNGQAATSAGIRVTGGDNRIEGNTCLSQARGVDVGAAGNWIVRNVCSGNITNWDVLAGNACLVVQTTNAPAILGDSGGTSPGSTNPNANYTY